MKKVYLHGALGKHFGEKWELNVSTPVEAVHALFANNPEIEKYLNKKHQDGVYYGIKKSGEEKFTETGEYPLSTDKDLHIFAIPQGAGFAGSLIMTAITTAASMYVSKKMAEAMERDDSALQAQTKSFIYNGSDNRFSQGSTIPAGYGRVKVGSSVISSCNINYDYNSEDGKIFNFSNGLYSLVPSYHKNYRVDLGPLISCFASNVFDGSSKYAFVDPAFQYITGISSSAVFGAVDGMYGGFEPIESQRARFVEKEGNSIGGYYYYTFNMSKGVNSGYLDNFVTDKTTEYTGSQGNWWANHYASNAEETRYRIDEDKAIKTSYVCIQSEPKIETSQDPKYFYPISFKEENLSYLREPDPLISSQIEGASVSPIPVGQRWRDGDKSNGIGWFKLESTSILKSVDLVSEGEIDGFAGKNGEKLDFKKNSSPAASTTPIRHKDDDYLKGVYLDDTPVKEVNDLVNVDAYNINEFDIDVGTNSLGSMGAEDQGLLEPQYRFTAYTKEINSQLFGPRSLNNSEIESVTPSEEFDATKAYNAGDIVSSLDSSLEEQLFRVVQGYGNPYNASNNYYNDQIISYNNLFYAPNTDKFSEYETFDSSKQGGYVAGDKVRSNSYDGSKKYYEIQQDLTQLKGVYDRNLDYSSSIGVGQIFAQNSDENTPIYRVTGTNEYELGSSFSDFAELMELETTDSPPQNIANDPIYILSNHVDSTHQADITEITTDPSSTDFWDEVVVNSPISIIKGSENIASSIFSQLTDDEIQSDIEKKLQEENYLSHTIINPLVEEVYVSLQVDELGYIYEGDEVEVHYQIGEFWAYVAGGLAAYNLGAGMYYTASATKHAAAAAVAIDAGAKAEALTAAADSSEKATESYVKAGIWTAVTIGIVEFDRIRIGTKIENSGELWPNKAMFRIRYGNEGQNLYETDIYMYGICTSPYRKDIKIYLPLNPDQRDRIVKVYKLNRERNPVKEGELAARYKSKMSLAAITEITPVQLNYANSVVIGTRVNAKDAPNLPKRTYNLRMKKVKVPSNYDAEKREYTGNWDGVFKPENTWTDNPAWCLYDLIENKRFGIGRFGIKEENIDRWTLYKIAKYCDELVPTGYSPKYKKIKFSEIANLSTDDFNLQFNYKGRYLAIFHSDGSYESIRIKDVISSPNKSVELEYQPRHEDFDCAVQIDYPLIEPRYTLNAYIMNQQNAFKLIGEFAAVFRSFAYWSGGAINFFQDEKKDPVMLFSNNNISEQGFSYSSTPKTSRTNSCNIRYVDRYNMYRPKVERAEDREAVQENNMIEQTVDGFGITSQAQAKRAAEFIVKGANLETEMVSFETSMLGSYLKPGDIIDILDNKRTVGRFAGKVIDVELDDRGIKGEVTIDYPIHTYIDREDKRTWKKITLYHPSGNETIASLDNLGEVEDPLIDNIRARQVGEFLVYDISEDNRKLKLYNTPYSYISGEYTWFEALQDSKERGGRMATVNDADEQVFMETELPTGGTGWLGGYNIESPYEALIWHSDASCDTNYIHYSDWAEGYPKFSRPIMDDNEDTLRTDLPEEGFEISADWLENVGNFLFTTGSSDRNIHGDWMHTSGDIEMGYMFEKVFDDSLEGILNSEGTTFALEDKVNLANKKQYKVMNISEKSNGLFSISALEYSVDKFDNIEKDLSIKQPEHPVIFTDGDILGNT